MDISGFNLNRLGNALKSKEGRRRAPKSPWGPVIVMLIMAAGVFYLFYR